MSERDRTYSARYRERHPIRSLLSKIRHRAKMIGVPFDLTEEDISIPDRCPVTGCAFVRGDYNLAASVDRIIPELGYVRGNIAIVSMRVNRIKCDATPEELAAVAAWAAQITPQHQRTNCHDYR